MKLIKYSFLFLTVYNSCSIIFCESLKTPYKPIIYSKFQTAAMNGNLEELKNLLLIESKESVDSTTETGWSAFMLAADKNQIDCLKLLLDSDKITNKSINLQDNWGWTALMMATFQGHTDIVETLLSSNKMTPKSVNLKNNGEWTAIMIAANQGHTKIIEKFLNSDKCSAETLNIKNPENKTASMIAKEKGFEDIVTLIEKYLFNPI